VVLGHFFPAGARIQKPDVCLVWKVNRGEIFSIGRDGQCRHRFYQMEDEKQGKRKRCIKKGAMLATESFGTQARQNFLLELARAEAFMRELRRSLRRGKNDITSTDTIKTGKEGGGEINEKSRRVRGGSSIVALTSELAGSRANSFWG